ncbi:hypothetical protein DPMN_105149 [Dreissena polymorpha]|uniref:Uncharacterized protein n=1 Tax=Dreissena polymorpha TaxID=45954 RepID=A0A9D4K305_DREPO|nr:hypothetical protein DPMN_105149 [Dreissena polymorpha]
MTFHEDRTINLASRVFTNKCGGTDDGQRPVTKAYLSNQETKVLTKFHENWAKNVTSRVLTCFHYIHIKKNALPTGGHVFSPIWTIFEIVRDINKTNFLTNFHDDWAKIMTSRMFTRKTAPPTAIFELDRDFIGTKLLTKFDEDRAINVASRFAHLRGTNILFHDPRQNCPIPSSHVFQLTGTIFELNSCIKETNVLSKFHENWAKNVTSTVFTCFNYIHIEKNAPPTGGHVFSPIPTIFTLVRDINKTNVLTNFHDDWPKIVTSRVFTRFLYSQIGKTATIHIEKNAPPTGGHVFSPISIIFELVRDIN